MILFINIKHNVVSVIDKKNFSLVVAEPEMHVLSTNIKDNFEHSTNLSCVLIGIKDTLQYFRLRPITTFFVSSKAQDYIKKLAVNIKDTSSSENLMFRYFAIFQRSYAMRF